VKWSILPAIVAAILSIFGVHHTAPRAQTATAAAAPRTSPSIIIATSSPTASSTVGGGRVSTIVSTITTTRPVIERIVVAATTSPGLTEAELDARLDQFRNSLWQSFYSVNSNPSPPGTAGGSPNTIALANRINNLANVSISNATLNGVSGLTASDIPALNYFPSTTTISITYGGTGTSTAPTANKVLLSDVAGNWEYVATSSLGISGAGAISETSPITYNSGTGVVGFDFSTNNTWTGGNVFGNSTTTNATTTNLAVTGTASTALVASNSFTFKNVTGFLKAVAGAVSTALINLASDVTGILPVGNGGTGWANIAASAIPYGNGSAALATTTAGTAGYVLSYLNGVPTWTATTTFSSGLSYSAGNVTLNTANANSWMGLQQFFNASTSLFSTYGPAYFGSSATSSFSSTGFLTLPSGFLSQASSTIGNGTQAGGLTISGGATTTGNALVQGTFISTGLATFNGGANAPTTLSVGQNSPPVGTDMFWLRTSSFNTGKSVTLANYYGGTQYMSLYFQNDAVNTSAITFNSHSGSPTDGADAFVISSAKAFDLVSGNSGIFQFGHADAAAPVAQTLGVQSVVAGTSNTAGANFTIAGSKGSGTGTGGSILFQTAPAGTAGTAQNALTTALAITGVGNVGVGTTTPYSRLEVWGPDTASSTLTFNVINNASTTVFAVFDGGNAQLSGTLTQSSDARLKTNIKSLDASTSLAAINSLTPVAYDWLDPEKSGVRQYGFIAQQVQQIFPNLVSTTSATALTPDGTLGLNYLGLIAPLMEAVQALSTELTSLENTIAGFARSFTTNRLCVNKSDGTPVCVTGDQLATVLAGENQSSAGASSASGSSDATSTISGTPPIIQINGNNPSYINVGDSYADLGAIITGPQADLNLGITTYVNGTEMSMVQIDTSKVATDTINYVVSDSAGLSSTSTRTVIIQAANDNQASSTPTASNDNVPLITATTGATSTSP
jgi:hypothetical protein